MIRSTKILIGLLSLLLFLAACSQTKTGIYLGQNLFLEKDQIIVIHSPEDTILKPGKTYRYSYNEVMESFPPQAAVKKITETKDKDIRISQELAKELVTYANAKIVTKDSDLSALPKDTVLITDDKDHLKNQGFHVVIEKR